MGAFQGDRQPGMRPHPGPLSGPAGERTRTTHFPAKWAAGVAVAAAIVLALTLLRSPAAARPSVPTRVLGTVATRVAMPSPSIATRVPPPNTAPEVAAIQPPEQPVPLAFGQVVEETVPEAVEVARAVGPLRGMGYNPTYATD